MANAKIVLGIITKSSLENTFLLFSFINEKCVLFFFPYFISRLQSVAYFVCYSIWQRLKSGRNFEQIILFNLLSKHLSIMFLFLCLPPLFIHVMIILLPKDTLSGMLGCEPLPLAVTQNNSLCPCYLCTVSKQWVGFNAPGQDIYSKIKLIESSQIYFCTDHSTTN